MFGALLKKHSSACCQRVPIQPANLLNLPHMFTTGYKQTFSKNEFADWFGEDFDKLNVVTHIQSCL